MFLKEIEISGFKSFPEKVKITLLPGINAFVGPNGCGKSNLVDAVRWGLGEQNPYNLRGTRMEDMIFSGTASRKPVGMAEVSLTFAEARHTPFPLSHFTITRRYFRSGESQYLLNRSPVRLRDIQEIFQGTGLGMSGYSFLSLEMIEFILFSKPRERRLLFDELAGITGYRKKKEELLREINSIKENLFRLTDITGELERQLKYIRRQANRAKRYQEIQERLKNLEIRKAGEEFVRLREKRESLQKSLEELYKSANSIKKELEDRRERLREFRINLEEISLRLDGYLEKEMSMREEVAGLDRELRMIEEKKEEREKRKKEFLQKREKGGEKIQKLEEERRKKLQEKETQEKELQKLEKEVNLSLQKLKEMEEEIEKLEEKREYLRDEGFEVGRILASLTNKREREEIEIHNLRVKGYRLEKDISRGEKRLEELKFREEELLREEKKIRGEKETLKIRQEKIYREKEEKTENLRKIQTQTKETERELEFAERKLKILEEMVQDTAGIPEGNRYLMEKFSESSLLGEEIRGEENWFWFVEAILGEIRKAIPVKTWKKAKSMLKEIRESKKGRVILLLSRGEKEFFQGEIRGDGILESFLPSREKIQEIESIDRVGEDFFKDSSPEKFLLTPQGEILSSRGIIWANYSREEILTGRKEKVERIKKRISSLKEKIEKLEAGRKKLEEEIGNLGKEEIETDKRFRYIERKEEELSQERERIIREKGELLLHLQTSREEREETIKKLKEKEKSKEELDTQIQQFEGKKKALEQEFQEILKKERERKNLMKEEEEKLREIQEREEILKKNLGQLEVELETLKEREREWRIEEKEWERRIEEEEEGIEYLEDREKELLSLLQKRKEELEKVTSDKEENRKIEREIQKLVETVEREKEELEEEHEKIKGNIQNIKMEERDLLNRINTLKELIFSLYRVDLERIDIEKLPSVSGDPQELREKLQRMGNINLMAIEEEQELKERYEFYMAQKEDVEKSLEELQKSLELLEREARKKFQDTFNQVKREFTLTFKEIFGGGEANLSLTEGERFEDRGVEIFAQPPGKKLSHLTLLSQGERTLVAISLLFAFFRIKPSPFCMLDEVDAPLDDVNVDKFINFLKSWKEKVQFLIISHNKKTLSEADALFGITMEEPGISRLISVSFQEAEKISVQ